MILITPDTIRSMNTYLGTSLHLDASHLPEQTMAKIIYLEGYLFDAPEGPSIFARAAQIAEQSGAELALSLSDSWCVERHFEAHLKNSSKIMCLCFSAMKMKSSA